MRDQSGSGKAAPLPPARSLAPDASDERDEHNEHDERCFGNPAREVKRSRIVRATWVATVFGLIVHMAVPTNAAAGRAKYYFRLHSVESAVPLDEELRRFTADAVKAELASRPQWESDLGSIDVGDRDAVAAALKKRKLSGFDLVVKIADVKKEVRDSTPVSRLKRLAVTVRLSILGTTLPGDKMAFGGDGEAGAETEVTERRLDAETESLTKDAIKDALKQAVDQVVLKLGTPAARPIDESKRKRKKD